MSRQIYYKTNKVQTSEHLIAWAPPQGPGWTPQEVVQVSMFLEWAPNNVFTCSCVIKFTKVRYFNHNKLMSFPCLRPVNHTLPSVG